MSSNWHAPGNCAGVGRSRWWEDEEGFVVRSRSTHTAARVKWSSDAVLPKRASGNLVVCVVRARIARRGQRGIGCGLR